MAARGELVQHFPLGQELRLLDVIECPRDMQQIGDAPPVGACAFKWRRSGKARRGAAMARISWSDPEDPCAQLMPMASAMSLPLIAHFMVILAILLPSETGVACPRTLDRVDRRILDALQGDARISNQELAKRVGLSPAPCWRRLRRLEEEGFIAGLCDAAERIGDRACQSWRTPWCRWRTIIPKRSAQFDHLVKDRPEVLECHSMSGPNDYLLRIVAASMEAYEHFLSTHMLQINAVRSVNTSFVLRTKKYTTRLPVV